MRSQVLIEEIEIELSSLDITVDSINKLFKIIDNKEPDIFQKAAMNQFISEFYNGIENLLKRICKYNNIPLPYGDDSHIKLFNLFVQNINNDLPLIFSNDIIDDFKQMRKFRHFVIHGYSFKIEWIYIKGSIPRVDTIYQIVKANIKNYINELP